MTRSRPGFIMITALWVIAVAGTAALATTLAAARSDGAARNRVLAERAYWTAEGCVAVARASLDAFRADTASHRPEVLSWIELNAALPDSGPAGCRTEMRAAGADLDVNTAPRERLEAVLASQFGVSAAAAAAALMDWRDPDDLTTSGGAERAWYAQRRLPGPANRPILDRDELHLVAGMPARALEGLGTQKARISVNHAPAAVLRTLPGFSTELVSRVLERRARGEYVLNLLQLDSELSPGARDSLLHAYPTLATEAVAEPEAWVLTVDAEVQEVGVRIELRLGRASGRVRVLSRRVWL